MEEEKKEGYSPPQEEEKPAEPAAPQEQEEEKPAEPAAPQEEKKEESSI